MKKSCMTALNMEVDSLIDKFVEKVNSEPREPKCDSEVPRSLRVCEFESGFFDWNIKRATRITWLEEIESKLPRRLPRSFRSLVSRYEYPALRVGPLVLPANTVEGMEYEFRSMIFADRHMSAFLIGNGLIQFARPADFQYDPICFDIRRSDGIRDFPIVRIDHEEILCNNRIRLKEKLSASFFTLVSDFVAGRF